MATTANVEGATETKKRGTKKPVSTDLGSYDLSKEYTLSSVNVPGPVYVEMVRAAADNGGEKDGSLITGRMSIVARKALGALYAPTFDMDAYEQAIIEKRNRARQQGGATRTNATSRKAKVLDGILDNDDALDRIVAMKAQGMSKEEILAALSES